MELVGTSLHLIPFAWEEKAAKGTPELRAAISRQTRGKMLEHAVVNVMLRKHMSTYVATNRVYVTLHHHNGRFCRSGADAVWFGSP